MKITILLIYKQWISLDDPARFRGWKARTSKPRIRPVKPEVVRKNECIRPRVWPHINKRRYAIIHYNEVVRIDVVSRLNQSRVVILLENPRRPLPRSIHGIVGEETVFAADKGYRRLRIDDHVRPRGNVSGFKSCILRSEELHAGRATYIERASTAAFKIVSIHQEPRTASFCLNSRIR